MSEEKPLEQVLFESDPMNVCSWQSLTGTAQLRFKSQVKAVIAEYQRRNGEPAGWLDDTGALVRTKAAKDGGYVDNGRAIPASWAPLYAAPQPLLTIEEMQAVIADEISYLDDSKSYKDAAAQDAAAALYELLKAKQTKG